ncbi:MAG: hypothetical protein JNM07_08075 [Phycisphaerae bacterium]|nr:hypothetical protein [Phycisphaerae bacterium]
MSERVAWWLGADRLGFGQDGVEFLFARPIPAWAWALLAAGAFTLAWLAYRRLDGSGPARAGLGACRALLLMVLTVILAGPMLVRARESIERGRVIVMADRSASMSIGDAPSAAPVPPGPGVPSPAPVDPGARTPGDRVTREGQLRRILGAHVGAFARIEREQDLLWLGFGAGAFDLPTTVERGPDGSDHHVPQLGLAEARRTLIAASLDGTLARVGARPPAAIVILSDGRSFDTPSGTLLQSLQARNVPVFAIPLGSERPLSDLSVAFADAPPAAFTNDSVPVRVRIERVGGGERTGARARLVDEATGETLDAQDVVFDAPAAPGQRGETSETRELTLTASPSVAGPARWSIVIDPGDDDLIATNNRREVRVELLDRPIRVLYVDGYPRWEYRFLKNLLVRESSVSASTLLLAPGRRFVQEGEEIPANLPSTSEEWARFDAIVIGDVRPEVFAEGQLNQIRRLVAERGAGLLWIAGEGAVPGAWRGTPLADLLPVQMNAGDGAAGATIGAWDRDVVVSPTPRAGELGVLRLGSESDGVWPRELSDPGVPWARLRWAQRLDRARLKPAAEVLATARPVSAPGAEDVPEAALVVSMRFGAGRCIYVGTDEIWRWRYGRGEDLPERFWLQLVRLMGRDSLSRSGRAAVLEVSPGTVEVGGTAQIRMDVLDQSALDAAGERVLVRVRRMTAPDGSPLTEPAAPLEVVLRPEQGRETGTETTGTRGFSGGWTPAEAGEFLVETVEPIGGAAGGIISTRAEATETDEERRRPEADHAGLARLCAETGGRVLTEEQVGALPGLIPNRTVRVLGRSDEDPLWDSPLALLLVIGLMTVEWVGRRLIRLA